MEESQVLSTSSLPLSPLSSPSLSTSKQQNLSSGSFAPQTPPPSVARLWRPAAQRNIRNQWSKLASDWKKWSRFSSLSRSNAIALVNSYLSQRYMKAMELGVLSDMPNIKKRACSKLFKQQELHWKKLLSSYKDMVAVVVNMHSSCRSMRTFLGGTGSPLVQFSCVSEDKDDNGDGGGVPVFMFWPISSFEELAHELVQMFKLELSLKRLLVVEFLSLSSEEFPLNPVSWLDELYPGEFDDLLLCGLYSKDGGLIHPNLKGPDSDNPVEQSKRQLSQEVLQVHLTTWLVEVSIDTFRVEEIFAVVGEEMHCIFKCLASHGF